MTPDQRKHTRFIIRRYLERCEVAKRVIHYSQHRPITSYGDSPERGFTTDCSGLVCSAFYAADLVCPWPVKNPGGYPYAMRQGWTGSILEANRTRRVPSDHKYFIGDMALFSPTGSWSNTTHVTICRSGGGPFDSVWTSHGSESGPVPTRLRYRPDLLVVVRSEALA